MDSSAAKRIAPCLGVDLDNRISFIREHIAWVVALPPLQYAQCSLIQRYRVQPTVLVIVDCDPQMATLKADLPPLQARHVGLPEPGRY